LASAFASAEVNVSFYFYSLEFRLWPLAERHLNYLQLVLICVVEQVPRRSEFLQDRT
jgi:hypothetical protein